MPWLGRIAFIAVICAGVFTATLYADRLAEVRIDWSMLAPLLLLSLACIAGRGILQCTMLRPFGARLSYWDGTGITVVSTILNEVLPFSPGLLFKPAYLRAIHGIKFSTALVAAGVSSLICTAAACAVAVAALLSTTVRHDSAVQLLMAILAGTGVLSLVPLLRVPALFSRIIPNKLRALHDLWTAVAQPRWVVAITSQYMALAILDGVRLWCAFLFVGVDVPLSVSLVASGVGVVAAWAAFVPGGLGFVEGAIAAVGLLLAYDPVAAVLASLVLRASLISLSAPLSAAWVLFHNTRTRGPLLASLRSGAQDER